MRKLLMILLFAWGSSALLFSLSFSRSNLKMLEEADEGDSISGISMQLGGEASKVIVLIRDAQLQLDKDGRRILRVFDSIIPAWDTFITIEDYEIDLGTGSIISFSENSVEGFLKDRGLLKISVDRLISFNSDGIPLLACSVVVDGMVIGNFRTELNSQVWKYPAEGLSLSGGRLRLNSHIFNFQSAQLNGSKLVLHNNAVSFFGLDASMKEIMLNAETSDIIRRTPLELPSSVYSSDTISLIAGEETEFEIPFILEGCRAEGENISADAALVKLPVALEGTDKDEYVRIPGVQLGFEGLEAGRSSLKASCNYKGWPFVFSSVGLNADGLLLQGKTDVRINSRNRRGGAVPVFADRISVSDTGDLFIERSDALVEQSYENLYQDSCIFADTVYLKPNRVALFRGNNDEVLFHFKEYSVIQPAGYEDISLSGSDLIIDSEGEIQAASQEVNDIAEPTNFYSPPGIQLKADKWNISSDGLFYSGFIGFDERSSISDVGEGLYIEKAVFDQGALYTDIYELPEPVRFRMDGWLFEARSVDLSNGRIHWYDVSWIYEPDNTAFPLKVSENRYIPGQTPGLIINYNGRLFEPVQIKSIPEYPLLFNRFDFRSAEISPDGVFTMDGYLLTHALGDVKIYVKRLPMLQDGRIPEHRDAFISNSVKTALGNSLIEFNGINIKNSNLNYDSVKVDFKNPRITGGIELYNVREYNNNSFRYGNRAAASLYADGVRVDAELLGFDNEKAVFSGAASAVVDGLPNLSSRFNEWAVYHDGRIEPLKCDFGEPRTLYRMEGLEIKARYIQLFSSPPPESTRTDSWVLIKRPLIRLNGKRAEEEIEYMWINTDTAEVSFGEQDVNYQ